MTLLQLRYIIAIDRYRHFGKAAEACGLTQSTLSLMVKKLEEELDVRIFDRDSHPVAATEIGRKIIDQAKVVLYNADQIAQMTRSEKETLSGPLKIALISTVSPVLVPGLFKYIGERYPTISLQTEEMLTETVKEKLRKAEVDMGILSGPVNDPDLLEIPLYHERFFASDWQSGGEITYERFFEGGRVGLLIQIVNENGGITIIPETHIGYILFSQRNNLRPIVDPERRRTISLAVRADFIHEAKLNAVVEAVRGIIPGSLLDNIVRHGKLEL